MRLFQEHDLRFIITTLVQESRATGSKMTFERLATAARVQKAHITNVLKGRATFQPDQLYLICKELKLGSKETRYLLLLLDHERSVVLERKTEIWQEVEKMQQEHLQTEKYIRPETTNIALEKTFPRYYLDPLHQIVHMALSIERFAQNPKLLESALNMSHERLVSIVSNLEAHKVIEQKKGRWVSLKKQMHLKRSSDLYTSWKLQIQNLAQGRSQSHSQEKSYGFTVVFSADEKARKKIQAKLLELINEIEPVVVQAPAQNVYQLSLDLLPWTE